MITLLVYNGQEGTDEVKRSGLYDLETQIPTRVGTESNRSKRPGRGLPTRAGELYYTGSGGNVKVSPLQSQGCCKVGGVTHVSPDASGVVDQCSASGCKFLENRTLKVS